MVQLVRCAGTLGVKVLVLTFAISVFCGPSAVSDDGDCNAAGRHGDEGLADGTSGWFPFGSYPGFYGFGLSYHLGYGYGGAALGVGAAGGYPFYGGPGYLHDAPPLRRFGHIVPFAYYSGPGYPFSFAHPGQLAVDRPLALSGDSGGQGYPYDVGFGPFTGAIPYPVFFFAPYAGEAAATGSSSGKTP